eukprot:2704127-Amphidinium_carterae.1
MPKKQEIERRVETQSFTNHLGVWGVLWGSGAHNLRLPCKLSYSSHCSSSNDILRSHREFDAQQGVYGHRIL